MTPDCHMRHTFITCTIFNPTNKSSYTHTSVSPVHIQQISMTDFSLFIVTQHQTVHVMLLKADNCEINMLSILFLKLIHVGKRGPRSQNIHGVCYFPAEQVSGS